MFFEIPQSRFVAAFRRSYNSHVSPSRIDHWLLGRQDGLRGGDVFFGALKPRPIRRNCSSSVLTVWDGISVTLSAPLKTPATTRGLPSGSECTIGVCPALASALATHWGNEWGATSTSDSFTHIGSHCESMATIFRRHSVRGTMGLRVNLHFECAKCEPAAVCGRYPVLVTRR